MKNRLLPTLVFALTLSVAFSQRAIEDGAGWSLKERMYVGGGFGLNGGTDGFGNRYFYVGLNPVIGYMVTPKFSTGSGITWQHYNYPDIKVKLNQYGVSPFLRYNFSDQFFGYGEYNLLSTPTILTNERNTFDRLLLGLGFSQPIGARSSINVMALYDVIYTESERVFASPWVFRVFFSF